MDRISIGWVWLEKTLNRIIDHLNSQKPLSSASIAVEESPNGTLLKVVGPNQSDQNARTGGPTSGGWIAVDVVDVNCNRSTIWVWGSLTQPP